MMVKCPFCGFDNEDGALFCEQCKSDLGVAVPAVPMALAAEPIPVAAVLEETVPLPPPAFAEVAALPLQPLAAEPTVPLAAIMEAAPPPPPPIMEASPVVVAEVIATPVEVPPVPPVVEAAPAMPVEPAAPVVAAAAAAPVAAPPPAPEPAAAAPGKLPPGAQPKLKVIRGQRIGMEFPIYPDMNFIGRADEKPVDIDLEDQEPPDRVWCSRQHALITFEGDTLTIEDLNSANGTYVNRNRVYPGQKRPLVLNDVVQIGTVQMKLII